MGVKKLDNPVDVELMWNCYYRRLQCIEVSPALIGSYVAKGHASKISDNNPPDWVPEKNNPMGRWSVKARMNYRLDPYNGAKVKAFNHQHNTF